MVIGVVWYAFMPFVNYRMQTQYFRWVERSELDKVKTFSQSRNSEFSAYNSGIDVHHFMEIKTAIKKLSKSDSEIICNRNK
jgi:hypothetical protein